MGWDEINSINLMKFKKFIFMMIVKVKKWIEERVGSKNKMYLDENGMRLGVSCMIWYSP